MAPSTRVLRLLSLLQSRREWSGSDLGARLEVDVRTLRRDVDRLRDLGYTVTSSSGPGGGYRLGHGKVTPPLLLDDDEAVAVAVALCASAGTAYDGGDVALRALAKIDQVLPPRARRKLGAIEIATSALPGAKSVDLRVLAALASACRDEIEVRFAYEGANGAASRRTVEPLRLVLASGGRRWYLAAWDVDREDFRTFRVDRITSIGADDHARRFTPREPPGGIAAYVASSITTAPYQYRATFAVAGTVADLTTKVPSWVGILEPLSEERSRLTIGGDTLHALVALALHSGVELELLDPPALAPLLEEQAARLVRAAAALRSRREPETGARAAKERHPRAVRGRGVKARADGSERSS